MLLGNVPEQYFSVQWLGKCLRGQRSDLPTGLSRLETKGWDCCVEVVSTTETSEIAWAWKDNLREENYDQRLDLLSILTFQLCVWVDVCVHIVFQ